MTSPFQNITLCVKFRNPGLYLSAGGRWGEPTQTGLLRQSILSSLSDPSELVQHSYEKGHEMSCNEAKILQAVTNKTDLKYK